MRQKTYSFLVMLAFLVGVAACQEHGSPKPPESRITKQERRQRTPAAGTKPVRSDQDAVFKEKLREELAFRLMARGLKEEEARVMARDAIPADKSLEEIYPADDQMLWEKTPEELREEIKTSLEKSDVPPEIIESEVEDFLRHLFKPPTQLPKETSKPPALSELDPAKVKEEFRASLKKSGASPEVIESEVEDFLRHLAQPPTQAPKDTSKSPALSELDPAKVKEEFRASLKKSGASPEVIESEVEDFFRK